MVAGTAALPNEFVAENDRPAQQLVAVPAPSPLLTLTSTTPRPQTTSVVVGTETDIDARFAGLLSHIRWLMAQDAGRDTDRSTTRRSERDDSLVWRQIDSLMDDTSEDFRDLSAEFDTSVLTVDTEATIAGSLTVAGTTTLANTVASNLRLHSTTPTTTTDLLYNTAGDLYWAGNLVAGSAVGNWASNGSDVYRLSGNVGIGTSSPEFTLDLHGSLNIVDTDDSGNGIIYQDGERFMHTYAPVGAAGRNLFIGVNAGTTTMAYSGTIWHNSANTGVGHSVLSSMTTNTAQSNTALGTFALQNLTSGDTNTAAGAFAGDVLTTGFQNTLLGAQTGRGLTSAGFNTYVGSFAGRSGNSSAGSALGYEALRLGGGYAEAAFGYRALRNATSSSGNAAFGAFSLNNVTSGERNVGVGRSAGSNLTSGSDNIAIGYSTNFASSTASNQLNIGNTIYGDLSLGVIGIGSTAPSAKLTIVNNASVDSFRVDDEANDQTPFVIDAEGNVGIGTSTPISHLSISTKANGGSDTFTIDRLNGTRLFSVKENGQVSIAHVNGTGNPALSIFGDVLLPIGGRIGVDSVGTNALFSAGNIRLNATNNVTVSLDSNNNNNDRYFAILNNALDSGGNELFKVQENGNVGIGTTSPTADLSVYGGGLGYINMQVGNASAELLLNSNGGNQNNGLQFLRGDSNLWNLGLTRNTAYAGANPNNFFIGQSENGALPSLLIEYTTGNIGIGTTSPGAKLDVHGGGGFIQADVNSTDATLVLNRTGANRRNEISLLQANSLQWALGSSDISEAGDGTQFYIGNTLGGINAAFWIESNGNIGIGTTTPSARLTVTNTVRFADITGGSLITDALGNVTASSDERLKDIAGAYEAGLDEILGLEPIRYNWSQASGFDTDTLYAGFSAQNVQDFLPAAVGENPDGFLTLSDRPILAALVNAVREVWERLTGVEAELVDLREEHDAELDYLRNRIEQLEAELKVQAPPPPPSEPAPDTGDATAESVDDGANTPLAGQAEPEIPEDTDEETITELADDQTEPTTTATEDGPATIPEDEPSAAPEPEPSDLAPENDPEPALEPITEPSAPTDESEITTEPV